MVSKTAVVDGITMRWEERGEGLPVVLVHGIPTGPSLWRHVMPLIPAARCLAWEMVGYGASIPEGRGRDISVAHQADYLVRWLRHLGVDQAILAGHDLGGGVVQIAAVRSRDLCAGLFLTNAIGYDSWPIPSVKAMRTTGPVVRHLPNAAFKQIFRTFLLRGHDDSSRAEEALETHWPHYEQHGGAEAFVRQVDSLRVEDTLAVADDLPKLEVAVRIAWGVADQFQKIEYGERFARDLKAPLRRIEGGKHFTPEDHPDIIAEEIRALVR
jgi:pimeloyl-ACP methyl ester carboxylesterase